MRLSTGVHLVDRPSPENVLRLDLACMPLIHQMHKNGIYLDTARLDSLRSTLVEKSTTLRSSIAEIAGSSFNPMSADQVADILFGDLCLEVPGGVKMTKTKCRPTVDDDCLSALASTEDPHPIVGMIQELRGVEKLKSTYVDALPNYVREDGRVHTTFRTTVARTGRLSSEEPNLMNIPVRSKEGILVRDAFTVDPRMPVKTILVSMDLSQIEMVMAAHVSQDANMCRVFREGLDIHLMTTCAVFKLKYEEVAKKWKLYKKHEPGYEEGAPGYLEMRDLEMTKRLPCKTVGFGVLYGQTPPGLQQSILSNGGPLMSEAECADHIANWFGVYPGVEQWMELQHSRVRQYGMTWDIFGRARLMPGAHSALGHISGKALREAGNHPIQSGAQGIIKTAMAEITPLVGMFQSYPGAICLPLLQIHDELIFELSLDIADDFVGMAKGMMEECVPLRVPVRSSATTGNTWMELK